MGVSSVALRLFSPLASTDGPLKKSPVMLQMTLTTTPPPPPRAVYLSFRCSEKEGGGQERVISICRYIVSGHVCTCASTAQELPGPDEAAGCASSHSTWRWSPDFDSASPIPPNGVGSRQLPNREQQYSAEKISVIPVVSCFTL